MIAYDVAGGQVLWSGMNFPYHVIRNHSEVEVKLLKNILSTILPQAENDIVSQSSEAGFILPQRREIETKGAKGVLFKEQAYPGWRANVDGRGLKIYKAGPAYPGFMYARLPEEKISQEAKVTFSYNGSWASWILSIIAFILVILILEEVFLKGAVLGRFYKTLFRKSHKRIKSWWVKDEIDE